jgi:hypothetical protein
LAEAQALVGERKEDDERLTTPHNFSSWPLYGAL